MLFSSKIPLVNNAVWHGALLWCSIDVPFLVTHMPPFPEPFKDFPIKSIIDSLLLWHKLLVEDPLTVKTTNEHRFDFQLALSHFLGMGSLQCVSADCQFAVCYCWLTVCSVLLLTVSMQCVTADCQYAVCYCWLSVCSVLLLTVSL
jgi:hypothetical protein